MTDIVRIGSEILVNTATEGSQVLPQITALSNGGFVVTWQDGTDFIEGGSKGVGGATGDESGIAVKAQVFAANRTKIGSEVLVNAATSGNQSKQRITALANGGFVVTWEDLSAGVGGAGGDADDNAVKAQVFAADGTKIGTEILVNTATENGQGNPQITALPNGGFVVTWFDFSGDPQTGYKAQVFAATGDKTGSELFVGPLGRSFAAPRITALSNGGFAVAWTFDNAPDGIFVKAQIFAADGTKIGPEILVGGEKASVRQITALSNGGFVVTWHDGGEGPGLASGDVRAQVFTAEGAKVGAEILVNTATAGGQRNPQTMALSNGGFVVTWDDSSFGVGGATGDASSSAVKAQVFAANGAKVGSEILVNAATAFGQLRPQITALSNGGFVVTWDDQSEGVGGAPGDASLSAVKAQVFAADGTKLGSEILVNTATAGIQGDPQITALPNGDFVVTWGDYSKGVGGATGDASLSAIKAQVFGVSSEPAAHDDFNGNGTSDLLLQNGGGVVATGEVANGALAYAAIGGLGHEWTFEGNGDFFGDGSADFLVQHEHGAVVVADVESGQAQYAQVAQLGSEWKFVGTGDFLGLGHDEFVIKNDHGAVVIGDAQNGQAQYTEVAALGSEWEFVGSGDFLGTGRDQFLIENKAGAVVVGDVQNNQAQYTQVAALGSEWKFVGTGDFLGLGHDAFLIKNDNGAVVVGDVQNGQAQYTQVGALGLEWSFIGTGDYLGDGTADFVMENKAGEVFLGTIANGQASYAQIGALGSEWSSRS